MAGSAILPDRPLPPDGRPGQRAAPEFGDDRIEPVPFRGQHGTLVFVLQQEDPLYAVRLGHSIRRRLPERFVEVPAAALEQLGALRWGEQRGGRQRRGEGRVFLARRIWLDIAFVLCGALMIVGVQGIRISLLRNASTARQVAVAVLLCLPAVGMVLCGLFPIDSGGPGHFIAANIVFLGPIVGFLGSGVLLFPVPRLRPIAIGLLVAGALTAAGLYGYFVSAPTMRDFRTIAGGGTIGLWERILGIEIVGWYVVLGAEALRQRVTW